MAVKTIQAVDKALVLMEHLARDQPVGVSALARAVGLDKMAVQRVLAAMEQSAADGSRRVSVGSDDLAAAVPVTA